MSQTSGDLLSGSCLTTFHHPKEQPPEPAPPTAQRSVLKSSLRLQPGFYWPGWHTGLKQSFARGNVANPRVPEPQRNRLFQLSSYTSPAGNKDPSLISAGNAALQNNPCPRAWLSVQSLISGDSRKPSISTSNYRSLVNWNSQISQLLSSFPTQKGTFPLSSKASSHSLSSLSKACSISLPDFLSKKE